MGLVLPKRRQKITQIDKNRVPGKGLSGRRAEDAAYENAQAGSTARRLTEPVPREDQTNGLQRGRKKEIIRSVIRKNGGQD